MQKNYAEANAPQLKKSWQAQEIFKGYPANVPRVIGLTFNPANFRQDKINALGQNFFKSL